MTIRFGEAGCAEKALVGGKGANLGRCAHEGFPVPPGFSVTTDAYRIFLSTSGLASTIESILCEIDFGDAESVERWTAEIRATIAGSPMPAPLAAAITGAYAQLGDVPNVAVRSSGSAEDLTEASFAGLHDTFLHVTGAEAVIDAVRGCWTSLWSARATSYRHTKGFHDVAEISMAVVVQMMVDADVSGVMFTANPVTANTDDVVINASWGLGESVVQGIITPDEFTVRARRPSAVGFGQRRRRASHAITLEVRDRTVGTKKTRVVRAESGRGTVTEAVPEAEQAGVTLPDPQLLELAELGRQVTAHYDFMPQDIEWALAGGRFYLLQSRPITGVEFDWAADMETMQWAPDEDDVVWTSDFANHATGPKSPLYYQWITEVDSCGYHGCGNALGIPELTGPSFTNGGADVNRPARLRIHKYHRAEVYHSTAAEAALWRMSLPLARTPEVSPWMTRQQAQDVHDSRFSYRDYVKLLSRIMISEPEMGPWQVLERVRQLPAIFPVQSNVADLEGCESWSDRELKRKLDQQWNYSVECTTFIMIMFVVYAAQMIPLLARVIDAWYDGENEHAFAELCQGVDTRSKTLEENVMLFDLADTIRGSRTLSELFATHRDGDFFTALEDHDEGCAFLKRYREFVRIHGHRGHEDRDFYFTRRYEDPTIDYRNFQLLLAGTPEVGPMEKERQLTARRQETYEDVLRSLQRDPLTGPLKAAAFKLLYSWVQTFMQLRDDERWAYEHSVLCSKLLCRELARRCVERGSLDDVEDFFLFTKDELYDMLDGDANVVLTRAKAAGRRRDFERALNGTAEHPRYLRADRPHLVDSPENGNGLHGTGWTSGTVTGTARVIHRLGEVKRVQPGDILVCASTDPGWTPVFMLISGIVTETGGVLSHATCLSREYGLPSVQLPNARRLIPDGAQVSVNGMTGEVILVEEARETGSSEESVLEPVLD